MGHIVVGVDETPQAETALRWAADEAAARGWRLTAVLAWDFLSQHHGDAALGFSPRYSAVDAWDALDAVVERALGRERADGVDRSVVCDLPAHALLDAARQADLLVVGTRDLHGIRRALAGSVSARFRRHPPCPVVIVHGDGRTETVDVSGPREAAVDWQIVDDPRPPVRQGGR